MRKTMISMLLSVLLVGVALAQNQPNSQNRKNGTAVQTQNGREVLGGTSEPEQRIQREVLHELLMLPYYSIFDELKYQVNGSTVTLMGAVTNGTVKSDAEASVKHIEGVQKVVNNIKVLPPSSMDDQIRLQVYRAIFSSDGLYRYAQGAVPSIHIIVDNGHVTLTGYVDNQSDKQLAVMRASSVPGVLGKINDDLQVTNGGKSGK